MSASTAATCSLSIVPPPLGALTRPRSAKAPVADAPGSPGPLADATPFNVRGYLPGGTPASSTALPFGGMSSILIKMVSSIPDEGPMRIPITTTNGHSKLSPEEIEAANALLAGATPQEVLRWAV